MYGATGDHAVTIGTLSVRFLVQAADSAGTVSVFECYVQAGAKMPAPHRHESFEEIIYGLEGVTTWTIGGRTLEVGPGETACVPRGRVHSFENRGAIDAVFLAVASPAVAGAAYVREVLSATESRGSEPIDTARTGRGRSERNL